MVDTNIAVPGNVAAYIESSRYPNLSDGSYGPNYAFDSNDNPTPRWNSALNWPYTDVTTQEFLGIDFGVGMLATVNQIRFYQFGSSYSYASRWVLESADDLAFTTGVVTRHTAAPGQPPGVYTLRAIDNPGSAQFWRIRATANGGVQQNGWGINTLELWGELSAGAVPQTITLDFFDDPDGILAPSLAVTPRVDLPFIADSDGILAPLIVGVQAISLPFVADSDGIQEPSVAIGIQIVLPLVPDPDTIFTLVLGIPQPQSLTLPFFDDPDTFFAPSVTGIPPIVTLPLVTEVEIYDIFVVLPPLPMRVVIETRFYGEPGYPNTMRYDLEQTIEVVARFYNPTGDLSDPLGARILCQDPNNFEYTYTYGIDPIMERLDQGVFRVRLFLLIPGRWFYRAEGDSQSFEAAAERSFVVRKSVFGS